MLHDLRQAVALLIRQPAFTLVAVLTLALGIGVNTAIFSVVDAALFKPLPYREVDRLVDIYRNVTTLDGRVVAALADGDQVEFVRATTSVIDGVEIFQRPRPRALASGVEESPWIGGFSVGLPSFLGVAPQIGRTFTREDVAAQDTIVLSDRFWRRMFGGDPQVLGKTIAFSDHHYLVIGVMPPTFRFFAGASADAWLPIGARDGDDLAARLRPGVTIDQATREIDAVTTRIAGRPLDWLVRPAGWNRTTDSSRLMLLSLLGAVGFVLLIACANVANLLLARTLGRQREVAVRASLGATRWQLVRQFLVEGGVLGLTGGVAAMAVAALAIRVTPAIMPGKLMQSLLSVSLPSLDARALAFGVACAVLAGLSCGIVPAVRASSGVALASSLAGARVVGPSRAERRVRAGFQALQVALTLVLLVGAGLLVRSFIRLQTTPTGFDRARLLYVNVAAPPDLIGGAQKRAFADEIVTRVGTLPWVRGAALGQPPAAGNTNIETLQTDDGAPRAFSALTEWFFVGPEYFHVAGIAIQAGRSFTSGDRPDAPLVVIVSENLAHKLWPQENAVGRRLHLGAASPPYTVVGVTPLLNTIHLADDGVQVFLPAMPDTGPLNLIVRTDGEVAMTADAVRAAVLAVHPLATVRQIGTMDTLIDAFDPLGSPRLYAMLMGALATFGLLTAAIGLFGLLSYSVSQRTREIGVRVALGADAHRVGRLVVGGALAPVAIGLGVGLLASWWVSRLLASQLFHVDPHDPATFASILALILVVCGLAAAVPAVRATRVDPVEALRAD